MDFSAAFPTFAIALREGVEAALAIGIVLACLTKAQQSRLNTWVYWGIVCGLVASALAGVVLSWLLATLATAESAEAMLLKPLLEGLFGLVAIALLSWMLIWMTQQARSLQTSVESTISQVLQQSTGAAWAVFSISFVTVLREGMETVLFIIAKFQQGWIPVLGAVAGLLAAVGMGFAILQWGIKINLRVFFQLMGSFLLLIVAGLLISMLHHFDVAASLLSHLKPEFSQLCLARASCLLGPQIWDASQILPDNRFPGIALKALLGYRQQLYLGQAIGYVLFLLSVGGYYFQSFGWRTMPPAAVDKISQSDT